MVASVFAESLCELGSGSAFCMIYQSLFFLRCARCVLGLSLRMQPVIVPLGWLVVLGKCLSAFWTSVWLQTPVCETFSFLQCNIAPEYVGWQWTAVGTLLRNHGSCRSFSCEALQNIRRNTSLLPVYLAAKCQFVVFADTVKKYGVQTQIFVWLIEVTSVVVLYTSSYLASVNVPQISTLLGAKSWFIGMEAHILVYLAKKNTTVRRRWRNISFVVASGKSVPNVKASVLKRIPALIKSSSGMLPWLNVWAHSRFYLPPSLDLVRHFWVAKIEFGLDRVTFDELAFWYPAQGESLCLSAGSQVDGPQESFNWLQPLCTQELLCPIPRASAWMFCSQRRARYHCAGHDSRSLKARGLWRGIYIVLCCSVGCWIL